jgi:hypothetical protein
MPVRWRLRAFVVPCPESPLQRSSRRSMPRVGFVARVGCARSGACLHGVWHVLDIHGYASQTVHGNSPSKNPGLSEASLTCRDESCIRECMQRVQVEVRVYRISEVCEPPTPVQRRSPTRSPPARGHRHSRTSVYRWSKIGRVARPRKYACNDRGGRNLEVRQPA